MAKCLNTSSRWARPFSRSKITPSSMALAPQSPNTPKEHRYDTLLVTRLGLPDRFIKHASRGEQLKEVGLDPAGIARSVRAAIEESRQIEAEATPVRRAVPQLR